MRKEILLAIIFGTGFGLIIAFGVWRLNSSIGNKNPNTNAKNEPSANPTGVTVGLSIVRPNQFQVLRNSEVSIEGATKVNSWVVAGLSNSDFIKQADLSGAFNIPIELSAGLNQITITSFDESGNKNDKQIDLVYSSQFPESTDFEETNKQSTDSVRTKVEEKLKETLNSPTAGAGTITDIFESTLHIKDSSDEIKQVSTSDSTTFTNEITKKESKFKDLAIGDYVVTMGYKNSNQVLNAKRILITSQPKVPDWKTYLGKVIQIKNKILTLSKNDGNIDLIFPKSWKGPDLSEIKNDDKIIVITQVSDGKEAVRTVQIIK